MVMKNAHGRSLRETSAPDRRSGSSDGPTCEGEPGRPSSPRQTHSEGAQLAGAPHVVGERRSGIKKREKNAAKKSQSPRASPSCSKSLTPTVQSAWHSLRKFCSINFWQSMWPVCGLALFALVLFLKAKEETFSAFDSLDEAETELYGVLELQKDATTAAIRNSYRKLSFRWHPDRNPGCGRCNEKMRLITHAYEILVNPEKRSVYDSTSRAHELIASAATRLTEANYQTYVVDSNAPWVIQVYYDHDPSCRMFARNWEVAVKSLGDKVNFGRINVGLDTAVLKKLPIRGRLYPTVFMIIPGSAPEMFTQVYSDKPKVFEDWVKTTLPNLVRFIDSTDAFNAHIKTPNTAFGGLSKIVIVSTLHNPPCELKIAAFKWRGLFDVVMVLPLYANAIDDGGGGGRTTTVLLLDSEGEGIPVKRVEIGRTVDQGGAKSYSDAFYRLQQSVFPFLVKQNVDLLCRSNPAFRVYCLIYVVDDASDADSPSPGEVALLLDKEKTRRAAEEAEYKKVSDGPPGTADGDEADEVDEQIHLQLVRLFVNGRTPGAPSPPPRAFNRFWSDPSGINSAAIFALDLDGHQYVRLESSNLTGIEALDSSLHDGLLRFSSWKANSPCPPDSFGSQCLHDTNYKWTTAVIRYMFKITILEWISAASLIIGMHKILSTWQHATALASLEGTKEAYSRPAIASHILFFLPLVLAILQRTFLRRSRQIH